VRLNRIEDNNIEDEEFATQLHSDTPCASVDVVDVVVERVNLKRLQRCASNSKTSLIAIESLSFSFCSTFSFSFVTTDE
jgi:hypothetical protein